MIWYFLGGEAESEFRTPDFLVGDAMSQVGQTIQYPPEIWSENGELYYEIDLTICQYDGPYTSYTTRCFNEMIVAHTLHIYPGDVVTIKMTNYLSNKDEHTNNNGWQLLNKTNLHFHGAHISADPPADDVLTYIQPWDLVSEPNSITYIYHMPEYHTSGLAWLHPHPHGAAALQTMGAFAMVVIHDIPGSVPEYISDLEEITLAINFVPLDNMVE